MITAEQARELSGPTCEEYLKMLEEYIRPAAEAKKRSVTIRSEPFAQWMYNESSLASEKKKTVDELRRLGFEVKLLYKESQFVDIGMIISW